MRALICAMTLCIAAFAAASPALPEGKHCEAFLPRAVEYFVRMAFPTQDISYKLAAWNDILCEDGEDMANVVVVVMKEGSMPQYGIFHLHYLHDGSVPRTPASFLDEMWIPLDTEDGWRRKWCNIINSVYPDDRERQNCF